MPARVVDIKIRDQAPIAEAEKVLTAYSEYRERIIVAEDLGVYAGKLVDIAVQIERRQPDLIVVPLRGGLKPGVQLEILGALISKVLWLPYSRGSSGLVDEEVRNILTQRISELDNESLKVTVLDTAKGGYGASHLAKLLEKIQGTFRNVSWSVNFHLIHPETHRPKIGTVQQLGFEVQLDPVPDLIFEDWSEALGFEIQQDGRLLRLKPSRRGGGYVLQDGGLITIFESQELAAASDQLFAHAITEEVCTRPEAEHVRDVWQDYTDAAG